MNAELWCYKENERSIVESWLINNKINYDENMSTKELIELYRKAEVGER